MTNRCRREAALLAVFLAQFEPVAEGQKPTVTRLTAREIDQWREDYAQALQWSAATSFSANDVAAIKGKCVDGTVSPPPSERALRADVPGSIFPSTNQFCTIGAASQRSRPCRRDALRLRLRSPSHK